VTSLRQKMTDELVRRNYSRAPSAYLRSVASFANYFNLLEPTLELSRRLLGQRCATLLAVFPMHLTWAPVPSTTSVRQRPVISESRSPVWTATSRKM
jgi:hypothetical protein